MKIDMRVLFAVFSPSIKTVFMHRSGKIVGDETLHSERHL
jgi:hypothetical protein